MHYRYAALSTLFLLALVPNLAWSAVKVQAMNGGQPVKIHSLAPVRDRNHEEPQPAQSLMSELERAGKSKTAAIMPELTIPLRRGVSNTNPGFMAISNYVDQDPAKPDGLLDWNCGMRTYDTDGFDHNGTDINSAYYPWLTMANDGLVVIAAADGEIVDKHDGEPDQQCAFNPSADPNLVILKHDDASITIYAHMKTGSVTPRKVGDRVEQGDYLGVVGSSGLSTGPHLHLGVQDTSNNLFDPYAGACNTLNDESLWADQESYFEKGIMAVATHHAFPEFPPCPQQEVPNFRDVFAPEDTVFPSVTVRDFEGTDEIEVVMRDPTDQVIFETTYTNEAVDHSPAFQAFWGLPFGSPLPEGKYTWSATFGGQTQVHEFYVGSGPDPAPEATPANNAFTGLWYDPALDGEGFNIVTTAGGTIVYFYGSDNRGNRVWLISALIPGVIEAGKAIEVLMFESTGGVFPTPLMSSRGLAAWGTLLLQFSGCQDGQSTLNGVDGSKVSQITKLAGVSGASCVEGTPQVDADWAGLWYDPSKDGEGYNLIVAPVGRILYFYGFKKNGLRLWLISELISDSLTPGNTVEVTMFEATEGSFDAPVPSGDALVAWGTARITVLDCGTITIVITGTDGSKTSNTVRLAGIIGSSCGG